MIGLLEALLHELMYIQHPTAYRTVFGLSVMAIVGILLLFKLAWVAKLVDRVIK
jgi:hypothetical protein